jgi:hypothetical protein
MLHTPQSLHSDNFAPNERGAYWAPKKYTYIPLPYTYNEVQQLRHYLPTVKLLRSELAKADHLLFHLTPSMIGLPAYKR